ncbi:TonB-dependent receptor domain-containing protein [Campylobacter sputorum]|uniref:TonB-dependent receptor domain-containing protein n=1 Tax=Campylobacter sputorum TaxID=206 RepID=UPI00053BDFC1|nr:TonB-dependent receptor [Campylobacter sputorum]
MNYKVNRISFIASFFTVAVLNANEVSLDDIEVVGHQDNFNRVDATNINVKNAALIKDIVRDIPGVYIGGANGLNQKLYIRGVNDRALNVTIDGARQKGVAFHHDGDLFLDADIIKAVDVGVGVNSVVGSSGALGGSVAFKTVDASDLLEDGEVFGGRIKTGYATNNEEWQQSLTMYGKVFDSLDLLGYVGHRGYKRGEDGNGDDIGGKGDDTNYLFKVGYNFSDYSKLTLSTEHYQTKGDYPFRAEWSAMGELVDTKFQRDTHTLNYNLNPNDYIDLDLNMYYTDHAVKIFGIDDPSAKKPTLRDFDLGVKTYGGKAINKTKFDTGFVNHTLVYGTEYYESKSYNKKESTPTDKSKNLSIFLEDQLRTVGFTLTPGIRYDRYQLNTVGGSKGVLGQAKYTWNEWSPGVSLDYQFDIGLGFYASWVKVFRGPDPVEALRLKESNSIESVTNGDLDPETGDAYEIGTRYKADISDNQSISFIAKYFYNDYDNLIIDKTQPGKSGVTRENGGRAVVKGGEIALRYGIESLSLGISYSRARTSYKDGKMQYGDVLAYSDSGDKYTFNAEYAIHAIDTLIGYNLIAFDSIKTKNGFKKPGYAVSDIYASWMPNSGKYKGLEINVGLNNIFDKGYWSHSQRSAGGDTKDCRGGICRVDWEPGRNLKASVSYRF